MDTNGVVVRKLTFGDLVVDDVFQFPNKADKVKNYKKVTEERRPYTPEPYSNAMFKWTCGDSSGYTFFYVSPSTEVI